MGSDDWNEEATPVAAGGVSAEVPDVVPKLFNKWACEEVNVSDMSLQDYIPVKEKSAKYLPHSAGRYAAKRFRKALFRIVKHSFEIIHLLTGENPLQVLVNAIINSSPREDSTRIGRAGTVRRQAVDVAPLRRVNQAIWLIC